MNDLVELLVADTHCPPEAVAALLTGPGDPAPENVAASLSGDAAVTLAARGVGHAASIVAGCRDDATLERLLCNERRRTVLEAAAGNRHLPPEVARRALHAAARWPEVALEMAVRAERLPLAEAIGIVAAGRPVRRPVWPDVAPDRVTTVADVTAAVRSPWLALQAAGLAAAFRLRATDVALDALDGLDEFDREVVLGDALERASEDPACKGRITARAVRRCSFGFLTALRHTCGYDGGPTGVLSPTGVRATWQLVCEAIDEIDENGDAAVSTDDLVHLVERVLPEDRTGVDQLARKLSAMDDPVELATALALRKPSRRALAEVVRALAAHQGTTGAAVLLTQPLPTDLVDELLAASGSELAGAWLSGTFPLHQPTVHQVRKLLATADLSRRPAHSVYSVFQDLGYGHVDELVDDVANRCRTELRVPLDPFQPTWLDDAGDDVRSAVVEFVRLAPMGRLASMPTPVQSLYGRQVNLALAATGLDPALAWPLAVQLIDEQSSIESLVQVVRMALT